MTTTKPQITSLAPWFGGARQLAVEVGKLLAGTLTGFEHTRVVCRFYDHPLIRELYPESEWQWNCFVGRKQSNAKAAERLIVRNMSNGDDGRLF